MTTTSPLSVRAVVLDFDGTFTDVAVEAAPFVTHYRAALADLVGRDVSDDWAYWSNEIDAHPDRYGWQNQGRIVAPGNADPYVRATTIAQGLLDEIGRLRDPELRAKITSAIYQHAYRHTVTAFRADAKATLAALLARGLPLAVITNATTQVVERKLLELAPAGHERLRLVGDAGKFVVCAPEGPGRALAADAALADELRLPGLSRPVCPRRGHYLDALGRLLAETGVSPGEVLVLGDIFELDLLVPALLGMQVHLVKSPHTPAYELAYLDGLGPRASSSESVGGVLARLA
jgi:FMN phosphatase YigB (HAD superfamily)